MSKPTNFSIPESLEVVWAALHEWQDGFDDPDNVEGWDDITLAMAWIKEALEGVELTPMGEQRMTGDELLKTHTYKGQSALDLD